jgi:hypothetical protein
MAISNWAVKDYDTASIYLSEGRKKYERPLYMRGLRLIKTGTDIHVLDRWSQFTPVTYHADGTVTISAPTNHGWRTLRSQTVRYNIRQFSGIKEIYQKNFECHLVFQNALVTPAKMQRCRRCKSIGLVDSYCGSKYCYKDLPCEEHPDAKKENNYSSIHFYPCEHGLLDGHTVEHGQKCYSCNGMGMRDYGSKLMSMIWDGSPLKLKDGSLVKKEPTELEKRIAAYVKLDS